MKARVVRRKSVLQWQFMESPSELKTLFKVDESNLGESMQSLMICWFENRTNQGKRPALYVSF